MSRVKIVKEVGVKPTRFENTVAKVLRLFRCRRAWRTVGRQRSRRGDFVSEGNPTRALFLYAGSRVRKRAQKKATRGGTQKTRTGFVDLNVATRTSRVERAAWGFARRDVVARPRKGIGS